MKFIKVKNTDGKEVLINLSNVSHFYSKSETHTTIYFTNSDDFITVEIPIKVFEQGLNAINDSRTVHVFC
jgi:translation elongation factor P/translation initiation factor 5A